jgi:hypothetical protein
MRRQRAERLATQPPAGHRSGLAINRGLSKPARRSCPLEDRTTHAIEHLHLAHKPIGKRQCKHTMPDDADRGDIRSQTVHLSGSIGFSVSPTLARCQFSSSSSR